MSTTTPVNKRPKLRLRVTAAAEKQIRAAHPWVYETSIREQNREGDTGELAVIYDRQDRFLAIGLYDAKSPIRVRILHAGAPENIDAAWWGRKLDAALERRAGLFDDHTTGYRWINGESDGWPALVLDRYGPCLVLKLYSASWLPRWKEIAGLIVARCAPEHLVVRLSRNIQEQAAAIGLQDGHLFQGDLPEGLVTFVESGLRFEAEVLRGQKTGFFLDQRDNRRRVENLASGRSVLNAFSFSGAFSVYAARGGARAVTDVDISTHALESSRRNHELNKDNPTVAACHREWVQADVFEWLQRERTRKFDLVILDPPSLARRESERAGAANAYRRLAALGAERLTPGGLLVCCSCSAHVSEPEFIEAALKGANSVKAFDELERTAHAPDHRATFPEARYLKAIYLKARE